jgi:hypothetical protein
VAQVVGYLPSQRGALTSNHSTAKKKKEVVPNYTSGGCIFQCSENQKS